METIKMVLPNGTTIEGMENIVISIMERLGYGSLVEQRYYNSSTRGRILISEMETNHLRNAIKKYLRDADDIENETFRAMVSEYLEKMVALYD
jgi:hypothetical protein